MTDDTRETTGLSWVVLFLCLLAVMFVCLYRLFDRGPLQLATVPASAPARESEADDVPTVYYPQDTLEAGEQRLDYAEGSMLLRIERLDFEGPVMDGVDDETLERGVGLFEQAKLPSLGNPNTSIAGHRDAFGCEFYYLDTLGAGDIMQLEWDGMIYTYLYRDTVIVEDTDWSSFYCFDRPLLTLMTCEPIGGAERRMIVTGELVSVQPFGQ